MIDDLAVYDSYAEAVAGLTTADPTSSAPAELTRPPRGRPTAPSPTLRRQGLPNGPGGLAVVARRARWRPPLKFVDMPANPARLVEVRQALVAWATAIGLPDDLVEDIALATCNEGLINATEHAYTATAGPRRGPDGGRIGRG